MKIVPFCAFVLGVAQCLSPSIEHESVNICGPEKEVALESFGETASYTINLEPDSEKSLSLCRLRITAPKTHVVYLQFDSAENKTGSRNKTNDKVKEPSCVMKIYLPDNTKAPFWTGNPCSNDKMPDIDLLTSDFKILWEPPDNSSIIVKQTSFILTAVGSGPFCKDPFQHTCMRIGRIPMLCISDHLLCDGVQNCPKSSTNSDEDEKLCKSARNAWENFFVELVKKYRPPPTDGKWDLKLNVSGEPSEWLDWQLVKRNTTKKPEVINETHSATESISAMLNKYGPWGYLMMGLLICGTVLFFCGLWECCCKRPKPEVDPPPLTTPTTVLVMGVANPMPPNYDDLDLPPSYTTLFPTEEPSSSTSSADEVKDSDADSNSFSENQTMNNEESVRDNDEQLASTSQEQVLTNRDSG